MGSSQEGAGYFDRMASISLAPDVLDIPQHGPGGIGAP